jgi:hypothetical protein
MQGLLDLTLLLLAELGLSCLSRQHRHLRCLVRRRRTWM